MLILDRKNLEALYIGDDITIEVLEVNGLQVRLGITAPRETVVVREELLARNPNCLLKGLADRHSLQQVTMHSSTAYDAQPTKSSPTKPKVIYKRRKKTLPH